LPLIEITLEQIKTELCKNENQTQKKSFESLLIEYPELRRFWNRPNKWQNDYYSFLFSAVAVGAVFLKTRPKL
jgi:hemoglobin-like flavoprotein